MNTFPFEPIELTHTLDETAPTWDGLCGFTQTITNNYGQTATFVPFPFRVQQISLRSGIGTHVDAPSHLMPDGLSIDSLPLTHLFAPCVVLDIAEKMNDRSTLSVQHILSFEKEHGPLSQGTIVMVRTGWDIFWSNPEKYRNNNIFPSVSKEAAILLLERKIVALGTDTPSPDRPEDGYPVHSLMLGNNIYLIENATNLHALAPSGDFIACLPLKMKDGSEAPIRLIGLKKIKKL
jgi:kynurenine formamidase